MALHGTPGFHPFPKAINKLEKNYQNQLLQTLESSQKITNGENLVKKEAPALW